jgi:predicted metal-dependent peptidase
MRGPALVIAIVVDTSGSMGQADLAAALAEIDGVLRSSGIARDQVRVLACDAAASTPQRVRSARDIRLTGGGGTDMPAGIAAAGRLRPAPHVTIVLTDGDTPWPERPSRARLVCAVISPDAPDGTPPWAVTVHIPAS